MSGLLEAAKANLGGITLYVSLAILSWRIHDYLHVVAGGFEGYRVLMGFEGYLVEPPPQLDLFIITPNLATIALALLGAYLVYRGSKVWMVAGYYLLLFNSLANLFTLPIYLFGGSLVEVGLRMVIGVPLTLLMVKVSRLPRLGLKRSCAEWLLILTFLTVAGAIFLDGLAWLLYGFGVCGELYGLITCGLYFDVAAAIVMPLLVNKYLWSWVD